MYGQTRGTGYKVRLVRMTPYDRRVCAGDDGRWRKGCGRNGRAAAAFVSAALALSVCCGLIFSCRLFFFKEQGAAAHAQEAVQTMGQDVGPAMIQSAGQDEVQAMGQSVDPMVMESTGWNMNQAAEQGISRPMIQSAAPDGEAPLLPKTMYLTFDDGPSGENTAAVLDILKEHDIKATFFVVGENVRKHPDMARRIVEEGHTIGIHCNRHEYDTLYESVESYLADFQAAYDAVYEVTGVEVKLFRFPGGSINAHNQDVYEELIAEMTKRGFTYFDWNGCLQDAGKKTAPKQLVQDAKASTLGRRKIVMLAHDIVYKTVLCLEELIASFPDYQFEALTEDVKPVQFIFNALATP